jgi:subtilisin family serine protease
MALATTAAPFGPAQADERVAGPGPAPRAGADPAGTTAHTQADAAPTRARVTLITGDRVTVSTLADGHRVVSVKPAAGNDQPIRTTTIGDHVFVLPQSAMPYLATDQLDRQLFDVTSLIDQGYDDASRPTLPLIVQYGAQVTSLRSARAPAGARRTAVLPSIRGAAMVAPRASKETFWSSVTAGTPERPRLADGISKVWLDGQVHADLAESTAQVGAPQAWADGYDGSGTTVAVLDTGIDATHPDLAGQVTTSQSFVPDEDTTDSFGHGTHVASTIAGTGAASDGQEKGVAFGAHLAVGKVLGNDGFGQESWIIAGMQWAADQAPVVNMSLGSDVASDGTDPMSQALDQLAESKGTLFVVAAGNQGCVGCLGGPGAADDALTVGGVDSADQLAWFSNMGPRSGDSALKPDLVAPGVDILAARSSLSVEGDGPYISMSGTSMASPHVAGAAAILAERHPAWSGQQIKDALMSGAHGLDGMTPYQVGTGRLDIPAALGDVHATGSVSLGYYPWPHTDDQPTTKSITYRNDGDAPVTLDLAAQVTDADGNPAADGAVTLSADQVTIPAGGTADVDVTGDPTAVSAGTRDAGVVVASLDGTPVARTSVGMDVESEHYDLTLKVTGRDGRPGQAYVLVHEKDEFYPSVVAVDGQQTLRLPPGTYAATSFMEADEGPDALGLALVGDPEVKLDSDQTVDLDASAANPITVKAPAQDAIEIWRRMEWHTSAGLGTTDAALVPVVYDHMYAQPTAAVTEGDYSYMTRWRLRRDYASVKVGSRTLDTQLAVSSDWVEKGATTTLAYAGSGSDAEFAAAHVRGKIAVVSLDSDTYDLSAYAVQAAMRGAKALVVINHSPGEFVGVASTTDGVTAGLPVVTVSGLEGEWLVPRAQSGARATLGGGLNSPYVYDLVDVEHGRIPSSLAYAPKKADLARIDTRYLGRGSQLGGEFRYEFLPYTAYGYGFQEYTGFPSTRVEYVSTEPGTRWYQDAVVLSGTWDVRGEVRSYRPGSRTHEDWFGPVVSPRLGSGYWPPVRQGDYLTINLPSFADATPRHTGGMDSALTQQHIAVYRGPHLLQDSDGWQAVYLFDPVPAKRLKYRVTNDATRSSSVWGTSTRSHTEWKFWSRHAGGPSGQSTLPFLSLRYQISTNLHGDAPAGHRVRIGLDAYHLADAAGAGRISGGWLRVSYDQGRTWTRVPLSGSRGDWSGHLRLPHNAARTVSLKAAAWDARGNRVTQEVIRAVGLH